MFSLWILRDLFLDLHWSISGIRTAGMWLFWPRINAT